MKNRPSQLHSNIHKIKFFIPGRKPSKPQEPTNKSSSVQKQSQRDENVYYRRSKQLITEHKQTPTQYSKPQSKYLNNLSENYSRNSFKQQQSKGHYPAKSQIKHEQQLDFGVVGIKDAESPSTQSLEKEGVYQMFTNESQRLDFFQFLEGLKSDSAYQNTITMFTVMYYYEQKRRENLEQST